MIHNYPAFKVTYLRVPKTASRSILSAFFGSQRILSKDLQGDIKFKTFTVVRNPYDRFVSAYLMFTEKPLWGFRPIKATPVEVIEFLKGNVEPDRLFWRAFHFHLKPMTSPEFELDKADRVFRFEQLAEDLPKIAEYVGVPVPVLPHIGKRKGEIVLTDAEKEMIYVHFEDDFKAFGYSQ